MAGAPIESLLFPREDRKGARVAAVCAAARPAVAVLSGFRGQSERRWAGSMGKFGRSQVPDRIKRNETKRPMPLWPIITVFGCWRVGGLEPATASGVKLDVAELQPLKLQPSAELDSEFRPYTREVAAFISLPIAVKRALKASNDISQLTRRGTNADESSLHEQAVTTFIPQYQAPLSTADSHHHHHHTIFPQARTRPPPKYHTSYPPFRPVLIGRLPRPALSNSSILTGRRGTHTRHAGRCIWQLVGVRWVVRTCHRLSLGESPRRQ